MHGHGTRSRQIEVQEVPGTIFEITNQHSQLSQQTLSKVPWRGGPTPVGEPNVRAEAEKENIDTPETVQRTSVRTGVSQKTKKDNGQRSTKKDIG